MAHRLYVVTRGGRKLFVSEHPDADLARWWLFAWCDRGFFPLANTQPVSVNVPLGSPACIGAYTIDEAGPTPVQTIDADAILATVDRHAEPL